MAASSARGEALWWLPARRRQRCNLSLADVIDDGGWSPRADTERLLALMSEANRAKVASATAASLNGGGRRVGAVFRRTRRDAAGRRLQRAEVRFDDVAGCLRTPVGGSSRQMVMAVEAGEVRSRLVSPRETARLMGLADDYVLPSRRTDAYHLTGDGVSVDAVRWLATNLFEPLLAQLIGIRGQEHFPRRRAIDAGEAGQARRRRRVREQWGNIAPVAVKRLK